MKKKHWKNNKKMIDYINLLLKNFKYFKIKSNNILQNIQDN
jgi:hypothetical protein